MVNFKDTKNQVVAIVGSVAAICFSIFGILEVDDRWNQAEAVEGVQEQVIMVSEQISKQMELRFQEQRLQTLYDQLLKLKIDRSKNPDDQDIKDWIDETQSEIERTKELIQRLREGEG